MANKLSNAQLKKLLANMPKLNQYANAVDNTGRQMPRPEENPASKEAYNMFLNQLQKKAAAKNAYINDAGPAPVYRNVGEKVRADLERESRQRDLEASIPNEKFNTWAENVGMPVADIAMTAEGVRGIPALLSMMGKNAAKQGAKNAEQVFNPGFFRNDREEAFNELEKEIGNLEAYKNHGRLGPQAQQLITHLEDVLAKKSPFYDLNHNMTKDYWSKTMADINTPEGRKRLLTHLSPDQLSEITKTYGTTDKFLDKLLNKSDFTDFRAFLNDMPGASYYAKSSKDRPGLNQFRINRDLFDYLSNSGAQGEKLFNKLMEHETQHHFQNILSEKQLDNLGREMFDDEASDVGLTFLDRMKGFNHIPNDKSVPLYRLSSDQWSNINRAKNYWRENIEKSPMLSEVRSDLINKGYIKNRYDEITPEMIEDLAKERPYFGNLSSDPTGTMNVLQNNRLLSSVEPTRKNYEYLAKMANRLLGTTGVGLGTNAFMNIVNNKRKNGN